MSLKGYFNYDWEKGDYGWVDFDQSEGDLWLQLGTMLLMHCTPDNVDYYDIRELFYAARMGSHSRDNGNDNIYSGTRYDMVSQNSLKAAEEWVFQKAYGSNKDFGYFKNDKTEQPVLVTSVTERENWKGSEIDNNTIAAYFTNFRVYTLMPSDEGTNYATEVIKDSINAKSTVASTVKNLTATTITGSQTVSYSSSAAVASSVNGSESYSYTKGVKVGAEYSFTSAFKASAEYNYSASEVLSHGWEKSDSLSTDKSATYSVSIEMPPYTQAMMTQTDSTAEYLTSYNCPIAIDYDVTFVMYKAMPGHSGIMHKKYSYPALDKDTVYTFSDPLSGARGDLDNRINNLEYFGDSDSDQLRWNYIMEYYPNEYDIYDAADSINMLRSHIPMAPTGASYRQTLNIVANEVSGLMPTHPLYRIKIAEPGTDIYTNEVNYQLFDYYTANMKVGDFSYADYLNLVGLNRYDVQFYGFSKGNGYWIVTDKDGNELDQEDSPVKLENDPVSLNWRYTAVKPGTCYLVYRIDEDAYCTAEHPEIKVKNSDLRKTAALEIIVTEKDPANAIVINGSYQGHVNVEPESLEGDNKLSVVVYDDTGKEIDRSYTWEVQELRGVSVTEDGLVSFTKDGTYHVRAVNGNLRSDWYEITTGHKPSDTIQENVIEPTCTKAGSCDLVTCCSICGEELNREHAEEAALGHDFDDGTVTREPTREKDGVTTYTCTRCGKTMTVNIPLTHTVIFDSNGSDEVPPQKVKDGKLAKEPPTPKPPLEDFVFSGWYVVENDEVLSDPFDFSTAITEDISLRAVFVYDFGGADNTRIEILDGAMMIEENISTEEEETILTREELKARYGLVLISSPYNESDVPQADKDELGRQVASLGATPANWFDISLYKMKEIWWGDPMEKLEDDDTVKLITTAIPVKLTIDVPEALQKIDRTYYLLQCLDGKAQIVAQSKDTTFSWTSGVFSTYLIAYKDAPCPMSPFKDTDMNAWYHDVVHWAIENSIMNGTSNNTFEPMTDTTRAMIVTMLWRMEGSPKVDEKNNFQDVPDGQWYTDAIRWAAFYGIVNGYDENTFAPNDSVIREQMATILYRYAQIKGQGFNGKWSVPLLFEDRDQFSEWAYEAICWLNVKGVINGMNEKEFSPKSDAVRVHVATMLMRFKKLI